jgi:pimeloyl-ACP methyl ester carboxylesterase
VFKYHTKGIWNKAGIITISFLAGWIVFHNTARHIESKKLDGKHVYVDVEGKKIHCWKGGEGKHTILMLSGYGTPSPILDFKPLTNEFTKKYQVVIIEGFGYGYSDDTNKDRTLDNIDIEIHTVLNTLNIEPPYVLVAHSISGILAHYFAAKHPTEIEAMIGIEPAVPEYFEHTTISGNSYKEILIQIFGLVRLASIFAPNLITPSEMTTNYQNKDLKSFRRQAVRNYHNDAQSDEFSRYSENGKLTLSLGKNLDLPVLYFVAENDEPDNKWKQLRLRNLEMYPNGQFIKLKGSHYLHRTRPKEMAMKINKFLGQHLNENKEAPQIWKME